MEIVLKKFGSVDFDDYLRLVSDIRVMAMITECSIPADEARRDYDTLLADNQAQGSLGHFRILSAPQCDFIGLAKLSLTKEDPHAAELGYMMLPEYWGQGIGGKVARLLVELADRQPGLRSLFAIIDPSNLPSRKILTGAGFTTRELKDFDGLPGEILERQVRRSENSR